MSNETALLAAIRENPAEDTVRLVYADWVQENGNEVWAALIRVQVALAVPAPERPVSLEIDLCSSDEHVRRVEEWRAARDRHPILDDRERKLLATVRLPLPPGWVVGRGLGFTVRGERGDVFLRRGLVERVVCPAGAWVADGDAVLARHPVERVRLTNVPLLQTEGDRVFLRGDGTGRSFAWADVRATWRAGDPAPRGDS